MSAYVLSYVGRVSLQSRGHSPHICIVLCWKSVPPITRSLSPHMYCLMLEECPSIHEVILPTYVLSYVGRVSLQSRGQSPHICIVLCWKSVPPITRSFSPHMYCLMLEECPSNHEVILPTYVTQSAAVVSHCTCSVFAHDPFPVSVVAPNSCIEIPKNH